MMTKALCCECGQVRTVSESANLRGKIGDGPGPLAIAAGAQYGEEAGAWRMIGLLKCSHCGALQRHAIIRQDEHRNYAEDLDHGLEPASWAGLRAIRRQLDED